MTVTEALTEVSPGSKPTSIFDAYVALAAPSAISDGTCITPSLTVCTSPTVAPASPARCSARATASAYAACARGVWVRGRVGHLERHALDL